MTAIDDFRAAMMADGLIPPAWIEGDDETYRCPTKAKPRKRNGAYCFDARTGTGWYRDHGGNGELKLWPPEGANGRDRESPEETAKRIAAAKAAIEKRRKAAEAAAATAVRRWDKAKPAEPTHRYLAKKGIKPNGLRQDGDILLVPVRDAAGKLHTLQTIPPSGDPKLFGKGSATAGHYFTIGDLATTPAICIGEGFATMARVHETTGDACIVAFSDHNLVPVTDTIAGLYPDTVLILCADDDHKTPDNPGLTYARRAASHVPHAVVAVPVFGPERADSDTDFADMAEHDAVTEIINDAIAEAQRLREATAKVDPVPTPAAASQPSASGSEDAMALELIDTHGHELRHVAEFGKWFRWNGHYWAEDRTVAIYDLARAIARARAIAIKKATLGRKLASAATVSGIERLARSDRRIALTIDQFDADPALLNTPGGIIDLTTGMIRPSDPAALCAQITAVAPADHDDCPVWKAAVSLYLEGDSEAITFLQRCAGYFLWGALVDQIILFACGSGGNGKGTVFNTLMRIMGSYAKAAPSEVFLVSRFDRHPTELARLHNARLVISSEIEKGRRWNMTRLNTLSGGDTVPAHFMRQDDFEYMPKFKLALFANNKPGFSKVDEAMRRRLRVLDFKHTVTSQDRAANPKFDDQIRAEWPAILRWMIIGCLDWRREGLKAPEKVLAASTNYLDSQDNIAAWLADGCIRNSTATTQLKDLFASWKSWCEANGEHPGTARDLANLLEELGFERTRQHGGKRAHIGLSLITSAAQLEPL